MDDVCSLACVLIFSWARCARVCHSSTIYEAVSDKDVTDGDRDAGAAARSLRACATNAILHRICAPPPHGECDERGQSSEESHVPPKHC